MGASEHSEDTMFQSWYRYAAKQSWTVDAYLRLVRLHELKTREQQMREFGATPETFQRLQAIHLPREACFAKDALRIATYLQLQNPDAFVTTMLLARQLHQSSQMSAPSDGYYAAAFDADEIPSDEQK